MDEPALSLPTALQVFEPQHGPELAAFISKHNKTVTALLV